MNQAAYLDGKIMKMDCQLTQGFVFSSISGSPTSSPRCGHDIPWHLQLADAVVGAALLLLLRLVLNPPIFLR